MGHPMTLYIYSIYRLPVTFLIPRLNLIVYSILSKQQPSGIIGNNNSDFVYETNDVNNALAAILIATDVFFSVLL